MDYITSATGYIRDNLISMHRIAALSEVEEYVAVLAYDDSAFLFMGNET